MIEVYKVGVEMALTGNILTGLEQILAKLGGVQFKVNDLKGALGGLAPALGAAAFAAGAVVMAEALSKVEQAAAKVQHQIELIKISGDAAQVTADVATAFKTSADVLTTTPAENLAHIRELSYAFGNPETAREFLPKISQSNSILESIKGGSADQVWEFVKALEEKGETVDKESFSSYVDMMTQAVIASGGRVTPQQYFQAFKYARSAKYGWDDAFVGQYLPRLIQEYGSASGGGGASGGPGNALMSSFSAVVGGRMTGKAVRAFDDLGLVADPSKLILNRHGEITGINAGGIAGNDMMVKNPYEWVQNVLTPALVKHNHGVMPSQEELITTIAQLFQNRTAGDIVTGMAMQGRARLGDQSPFEKDAARARQALTVQPAYDELMKHDPTLVMAAFTAQFETMLQALGSPLVQPTLEAMRALTSIFTLVGQFANAHPEAAMDALRTLLMASTPSIVPAVTAIAELTANISKLGDAASSVIGAITSALDKLPGWLGGGPQGAPAAPGTSPPTPFGGELSIPLHPSSFIDNDQNNSTLRHAINFSPPTGGDTRPIVNTTALNIDGAQLAQVIASKLADIYENSPNSPAANGIAYYDANGGLVGA